MSEPLDNPIYASLSTSHARFMRRAGHALKFDSAVSPLAGFEGPSLDGLRALAEAAAPGEECGLFLREPAPAAAGWTRVRGGPLQQMVQAAGAPATPARDFVELGERDAQEMLELAALTKPGPFSLRTRELGGFVGVREGGRLAAMSGERLRLPGFTEVSAVCTHPEHLGRGHAAALMSVVAQRIRERGETPFLHVVTQNARAIALYERLGFARRIVFDYALLRRS